MSQDGAIFPIIITRRVKYFTLLFSCCDQKFSQFEIFDETNFKIGFFFSFLNFVSEILVQYSGSKS